MLLTEDQILTAPAGMEMDAWICRAYGYRVHLYDCWRIKARSPSGKIHQDARDRVYEAPDPCSYDEAVRKAETANRLGISPGGWMPCPYYCSPSEEIGDVWPILESLPSDTYEISLRRGWSEWTVFINKLGSKAYAECDGETAPLALCRALLLLHVRTTSKA